MQILEDLLSVQEAANILNLDRSRVGRLCRQGRFKNARKIGERWVIPREAVENHKRLPPGPKPTRLTSEQTKEVISKALGQTKEGDTRAKQ